MEESAVGLLTPATRQKTGSEVSVWRGDVASEPVSTSVALVIVVPPSKVCLVNAAHAALSGEGLLVPACAASLTARNGSAARAAAARLMRASTRGRICTSRSGTVCLRARRAGQENDRNIERTGAAFTFHVAAAMRDRSPPPWQMAHGSDTAGASARQFWPDSPGPAVCRCPVAPWRAQCHDALASRRKPNRLRLLARRSPCPT